MSDIHQRCSWFGVVVLGLLIMGTVPASAQPADAAAGWERFSYLVGEWTGVETATFGSGTGGRSYAFVMQDRYLLGRNRSVFPPQDGLPDGDDHEDWTVLSYDRERELFVLRQFNSEGFVNTFRLDDGASGPGRFVFVLEASENASGTTATLTHEQVDGDTFEERFELQMPAAPGPISISNRWTRVGR